MTNLQINISIKDNKAVEMELIIDGINRVEYVQEWEEKPMKKIEVLQELHNIIDDFMK